MSNNIVEENPTAKPAAGAKPAGSAPAGGEDKVRKQARQLAYDVRYKVKQGFKDGQKTDPASLKQAFMSQLGKSPAPGPVKAAAKKMLVGEAYDFVDISEDIDNSISNVFGRVFVKKTVTDDADGNPAFEITDLVQEASGEKKYQVRVKDKKTGKSYTRYADRAKISELRKNPNIESVEMTGYGKPYEGEKNKGEQTASVKSGKGLSDKDYDGDGKKETPEAEYKGSKDKAIKKALRKESVGSAIDKGLSAGADTVRVAGKAVKDGVKTGSKVAKGAGQALGRIAGTPVGVAKAIKKGFKAGTQAEEVVQEADSLAAQTARWEANRQRRMKKSGSYERPNWIPRDQDHEDRYGSSKGEKKKPQKTHANLQNEEFIDEVNAEDQNPGANTKKIDVMKGKNTIKINPTQSEAKEWAKIAIANLQEKEVKVKDTKKVVDAIRAYDKSKDASKDADWDTEHGEKEKGDIEKKYAKKERGEIDKDDPNWKKRKYHTGMHGEDKNWGYDKDGKSLNPADQEEEERKDDELFGSPKGKKGKKKVKKESVDSVIAKILMGESGPEQQKAVEPPTKNLSKSPAQVDKLKKPDTEKQDVKSGPEIAVTFDGPNYPPATIDAQGDGRDMPTILNLIRNKWRAKGIMPLQMSNDMEGENLTEKKSELPEASGNANAATSVKPEKPAAPQQVGPEKKDSGIANKERRVSIMKRQILQKKMQAVRAGAGADIVAHHEPEGDTIEESEKVAQGAQKRATELGAKRRQASYKKYGGNVGSPGKNERAGYNLARKARSAASSPETQVTKKKRPAGSDTSQIGHARKRDEKTDVGKSGKKLKTSKYKLSFKDRQTHHTRSAEVRRDPKQNPKHTAHNEEKNWIQKAEKTMRKDKPCTGDKFGSETCPPGSKRYNLAKTFRKMAKEHHQKDATGKVIEHGDGTPSSVEEQELKEYSPNVSYQAKGGKKSGKLGKSSVYSLRGKDESKKDFRKSHVKDVEGGYVGGGHKPTPGSLKKEDYYRGTGEKVVARTKKWMDKKGQKGAPGLDAMKARTAEHKAKRGVNEASVALAANIKIKNEKQRKKDQAKLAKLTHIYKGMKTGQYNSHELEGEVIDERTLSSYIPSDRKAEFDSANREYMKAMMKKKEDESTKNRGDLRKRDAGKMAKERLHDKKHGAYGEGYQRDPDRQEKDRKTSKQTDPSKAGFTGISDDIGEIMRQNAAMKKAAAKKKGVKEEVVTELNRYGKETGKATGSINKRAGTPIKRGGSTDRALNYVRSKIRKETGKPEGQQKKVKGEKDRVQYGNRRTTPADSIAKRRQSRADAEKLMRDTSGT